LADYFTKRGYPFVTIQHDCLGDTVETIDPSANQHEARKHLYIRGVENIAVVLKELAAQNLGLKLDKLILAGHSNGGDIAKYFANDNGELVSQVIMLDARRCRLEPSTPLKVLMFEADDTTTDQGVLPEPSKGPDSLRSKLEWTIIKPTATLHASFSDDLITTNLKATIYKALDWFLA
jgi:pimeloyl-ACP methyl ester carboxylesterase